MFHQNLFCLKINFNNHIKINSNKKCPLKIKTSPTQIVNNIFLIEIPILKGHLKIIYVQNNFRTAYTVYTYKESVGYRF